MRAILGRSVLPLGLLFCGVAGAGASAQPTQDDFFNPAVLHEIRLRVHSRDWARLKAHYLENTYYPCDMTWNGIRVANAAVRSRGSFTRSATKPGLRVDFNRYASTQRFLGLTSLVLDNLAQDPSMMREALAMRVFARMGAAAPREAFTRLYVNGAYMGLYASVEPIEPPFLDRTFGESDGYLFDYQLTMPWDFSYLGPDLAPYVAMFQPQTRVDEPVESLVGPIERLVWTVNEVAPEDFEAQAGALIDLPGVVRHLALQIVVGDIDGIVGGWGMNNFYLYRSVRTGQSRLIVWDQDQGFQDPQFPIDFGLGSTVLVRRTLELPHLWQLYLDTLMASADALGAPAPGADDPLAARTWIEAEVDQTYELIREAALNDPLKPWTDDDFEVAVDQARIFARLRAAYLRNEVSRLLDPSR